MRVWKKALLILRTVVHLRPRQMWFQVYYRLYKPTLPLPCSTDAVMAAADGHWHTLPLSKYRCWEGGLTFRFLNVADGFSSWNDVRHGMLWAYNLNYMDWLMQDGISLTDGQNWMERFMDEMPENRVGLDPYPIALRGLNWIKFITLHPELDAPTRARWNAALRRQYRLLERKMEYHLLGNHLLEDAFSCFVAALYFSDAGMYARASGLLLRQLREQILPDGAHYEQSAMYHCILLDRLLDCYNFSMANQRFDGQPAVQKALHACAVRMLGHLESIAYADGTIPLFNDAANSIAPTVGALRDYARRLGLAWQPVPLKECGYRRLQHGALDAVVDVGDITATYQPGHTHADTFSYELRMMGRPIVVDTGISTYDKTPRRQYERGTCAHNTVSVDGHDSSEVWGGFRVGRRAQIKIQTDNAPQYVQAEHNGFGKTCRRTFSMRDQSFQVTDQVATLAESFIHLAPSESVEYASPEEVLTTHARISISPDAAVRIADDAVATEYNSLHPSKVIIITFRNCMTYSISMR